MLIDLDRLAAYKQLLRCPTDPTITDHIGHRTTQNPKPSASLIADLKIRFVRHLVHRQLSHRHLVQHGAGPGPDASGRFLSQK